MARLGMSSQGQGALFLGGSTMIILVPWKPVALVLGVLSALILVSYFGSALMNAKGPFAVSKENWQTGGRASCHQPFNWCA